MRLADRLQRLIKTTGPIPLAQFMAEANAHYYATRDPLGTEGDFTTAPEISQMFGELVGLWLTDLWQRAGSPAKAHYVELGPGRGTLAEDALRAMRAAKFEPPVHLVETSPALRDSQTERLSVAGWHDDIDSLPENGPLLVVANEFFDALPIQQIVKREGGWYALMVMANDEGFAPVTSDPRLDELIPETLRDAPDGSVLELATSANSILPVLSERVAQQGGAVLVIDYGYEGPMLGDTLQAVSGHKYADVFAEPGERDLTAHVDFTIIKEAAKEAELSIHGPVDQGRWLESLGIGARSMALAKAAPDRQDELAAARKRLTTPDEMGSLFQVMALTAPDWPQPAAF